MSYYIRVEETEQGLVVKTTGHYRRCYNTLRRYSELNAISFMLTDTPYRIVKPGWIGALTDSPIIAKSKDIDVKGGFFDSWGLWVPKINREAPVWWQPNYMTEDLLQILLDKGEFTFTKGE